MGEISSKAITPFVFVVLARLLTPEDFGVVVAATMVITFSQSIWEAGMGKAIIQFEGDRDTIANTAFWINIALAVLVAGLIVVSSSPIAEYIFHDSRVSAVLKIMAIQVLLSASVSIHTALLQKDMNFRHLFWVRLATVAVPGLTSIPLAWYGMGYWSFVAGTLVGQILQVSILWKTSPWQPRINFDLVIAKKLLGFGGWITVTALLVWFYMWADSFIVGIYLGSNELGLYRIGNAFVIMIYGLLFGPLIPVLYTHLTSTSQDLVRIQAVMLKVVRILIFVSLPLAAIISANADLIGGLVFGPRWQGVGLVISIMALTHGVSWVITANGEAYRALGNPSVETKVMAFSMLFYLVGYLVSIQQSFEVFLWTRFGLAVLSTCIHFWVMKSVLKMQIKPILANMLTVSLICVIPIVVVSQFDFAGLAYGPVLKAFLIVMLIAIALAVYEKKRLIPQIFRIVVKAIKH
ncbi:MAG: lipopolysaccharide biosynthesis protein [Desulfuromusa sp.]|nr:lipopolysaccharide biosynthesis protein [Desulfuromusa sp.]